MIAKIVDRKALKGAGIDLVPMATTAGRLKSDPSGDDSVGAVSTVAATLAAAVAPEPAGGALTAEDLESTFAAARLRQRVTKGSGSRAAGVAMAFKLIESAQARWRTVNAPHLVALVRAGAKFERGQLVERPDGSGGDQQVA